MPIKFTLVFLVAMLMPLFCGAETPVDAGDKAVLEEVEVRELSTADPARNASAIRATVATRELPVSVETLSPQVLDRLRTQNLESLLDVYSSGNTSPGEGGIGSAFVLRGFTDTSFYRNGQNHSQGTTPLRDVANIATVEILKGASSALYGPGEPGGVVNIITKQPLFEAEQSAAVSIGSYQRYRAEVDSTGPLLAADAMAYRMIAAYEDTGSFRDTVDSSKVFVAPSLSWVPGEDLNVLAELEYIQQNAPYDTGLVAVEGAFPLPLSTYLGEPALGKTRSQSATASLSGEYRPDDKWGLSAKLLWQDTNIDGFRAVPEELAEINAAGTYLLSRSVQHEVDDTESYSAQFEIFRSLRHAGIGHQFLAGYEYLNTDNAVDLDASDPDTLPFEIDILDVSYGRASPALSALRQSRELLKQHSLYIQDFISIGERFKVLLGTRLDRITIDNRDVVSATEFNQEDTDVSSRVGLLFALNPALSLFASYSESIEPNEGLTPAGEPLQPSIGEAYEAGIKLRHTRANLAVDASVYRIEQTNVAVDAPGAPGFEIQTARQKSEGLDLAISLSPTSHFVTQVNYVYADAQIFDDPAVPDGTQPINAPLHKLVLSGFVSFNIRHQDDLQAGLSFTYRSAQKASLDPDELGVKLPGYWLGEMFLSYALSPRINLGLHLHNLFDRQYLAASQNDLLYIHPGAPLTVTGSIKFTF